MCVRVLGLCSEAGAVDEAAVSCAAALALIRKLTRQDSYPDARKAATVLSQLDPAGPLKAMNLQKHVRQFRLSNK